VSHSGLLGFCDCPLSFPFGPAAPNSFRYGRSAVSISSLANGAFGEHHNFFSLTVLPGLAQTPALDALVRAYPDFLASHNGGVLIWKDGTRMSVSDGRTDKDFEEKLHNPSILDQLSIPYIKGPLATPPGLQDDPGRFRNIASSTRCTAIVRKVKSRKS
jgi:hypothetical protein